MIKLGKYTKEFEEEYFKAVTERICQGKQEKVIESCMKFLPKNFFLTDECFKELVLAPYKRIKEAVEHIETCPDTMRKESFCNKEIRMREIYSKLCEVYKSVASSQKNNVSIRVRMVNDLGLTVCPYCNREYINCRRGTVSGAQLDHFYCKSKYPIFAVSLYNLIPSCSNCNRIKSDGSEKLASPFDSSIEWDNDIKFSYSPLDYSVTIEVDNPLIENNIKELGLREAYKIHSVEVKNLEGKVAAYSETQIEEIRRVLTEKKLSEEVIKKAIFGPEIKLDDMKTQPLGKMMSDLHKKLGVY